MTIVAEAPLRAASRRNVCEPTDASLAPAPASDGRNCTPSARNTRRLVLPGESTPSSTRASRAVPPTECASDARAARSEARHSALVASCSIRNVSPRSGSGSGSRPILHLATSPSGRTRSPGTGSEIGEPRDRSKWTSASRSDDANTTPAKPAGEPESTRSKCLPHQDSAANAASNTPISST